MNLNHTLGQTYLDLVHRYLQGRLDRLSVEREAVQRWAEDRETLWEWAWTAARPARMLEREQIAAGIRPPARAHDPRRLPRMIDRLCDFVRRPCDDESFRKWMTDLLAAYRDPESDTEEAQYVRYPPRVNVFERPLPAGSRRLYPCTLADIRAQLALVPEHHLAGLWAIGLAPPDHYEQHAYGIYYRTRYPLRAPLILLFAQTDPFVLKFDAKAGRGTLKRRYRVEREFGMLVSREGDRLLCRWPAESHRRFMVGHVLMHEIGRHVQYEQRRRAGYRRRLPSRIREQFAEDYAIRFQRELERRR